MKYLAIIVFLFVALGIIAAPREGYSEPTITQDQATLDKAAITNMPAWNDYQTNRAAYTTDKATYTGTVATVADANTKQAIRQLAAMVQDLQAQIIDIKKTSSANAYGNTNSPVVYQ